MILWVSRSAWVDPSLHTVRRCGRAPEKCASDVTEFLDPVCEPFASNGVDWFWRTTPTSVARLFRAQNLAGHSLRTAFPWATAAIAVVSAWLARLGPQATAEAEKLAQDGPVILPPFDPCCVDMARYGQIARWLDWEKDSEKLAVSNGSVAPPTPSDQKQTPTSRATTTRGLCDHAPGLFA
jgi:hypothetical protein